MAFLVNFHTNATRIGWDLWEIDLGFAPQLPPGWRTMIQQSNFLDFYQGPPVKVGGRRRRSTAAGLPAKGLDVKASICSNGSVIAGIVPELRPRGATHLPVLRSRGVTAHILARSYAKADWSVPEGLVAVGQGTAIQPSSLVFCNPR